MKTTCARIARTLVAVAGLSSLALAAASGQSLHDADCNPADQGKSPARSPRACANAPPATGPAHVVVATTGVRTISLPTFDVDLPAGPGKLTLVSTCTLCHTPRYVTMQPNFSRKKWTDEVEKMKKVYGAPIQDEQVEPIVNYLVAIRGNGQ